MVESVAAMNLYGDAASEVAEKMLQWAGSAREVASASQELVSVLSSAGNNEYYRQLYEGGDRSSATIQTIAQQTGLSEDIVRNRSDLVLPMLGYMRSGDQESVSTSVAGLDIHLQDDEIRAALGLDGLSDGDTINLTERIGDLANLDSAAADA